MPAHKIWPPGIRDGSDRSDRRGGSGAKMVAQNPPPTRAEGQDDSSLNKLPQNIQSGCVHANRIRSNEEGQPAKKHIIIIHPLFHPSFPSAFRYPHSAPQIFPTFFPLEFLLDIFILMFHYSRPLPLHCSPFHS